MAYFSNGTDGMTLEAQCQNCPVGQDPDAPCPVLLQSLMFNYEQCKDGQEKLRECMNLTIDEDGKCKMRDVMLEYIDIPGFN